MNNAEFIIEYISKLGVNDIFTVSGGGSIYLCDALRSNNDIHYVCCHHEQGVIFAAEGYARSRNTIGVSVVTSGPGGTNVLTGLNAAYIDSIPLLVITGQVFSSQMMQKYGVRQFGLQESNIVDLAKPITKFSKTISPGDNIKEILDYTINTMRSPRMGPALLDIPVDVQKSEYITTTSLKVINNNLDHKTPSEDILQTAIRTIRNSKKPLLLLGHGVVQSQDNESILNYLDSINIPITTSWNATELGYLKNFAGRPGMFNQRYPNIIINQSDVLIVLGCRLHIGLTGYDIDRFAKSAKIIWVDVDENELSKYNNKRFIKVNCKIELFVDILKDKIDKTHSPSWLNKTKLLKNIITKAKCNISNCTEVESFYFISKLSEELKVDDIVVTDMGLAFVGTHQYINVKKGNKVFSNAGHAPMGWGLPAAIGAAIRVRNNGSRVFCISGEGGLMMNIQELATLRYHNLNVIIFIFNNGGYQTIKQTQQLSFNGNLMGATPESGLFFPDFQKIATSFSIDYKLINDNDILDELKIGNLKGPILVELLINKEQEHGCKLITRKTNKGEFIYSDYDDVYPHIDNDMLNKYRSILH